MGSQSARKLTIIALMVLLSGVLPASADNQQDYCIKCSNPDQTYICRIISNGDQAKGKQLFCILNIAKEQGHDSCSATAEATSCSGVLVQYDVVVSQTPPPNEPPQAAAARPEKALGKNKKDEPRTLVEFSRQATKATKKSINKAGRDTNRAIQNTGKAIKKTGKTIKKTGGKIVSFTSKVGSNIKDATTTTFKCITSLFSSCSSE